MITKEDFMNYEEVRESGTTNMFNVRMVCMLSGLEKEEVKEIIKNYSELKKKYMGLTHL